MAFDAVCLSLFSSCSCSIAFNPKGVAALSKPNRLAEIFIKIEPVAGCPFGISGNNLQKTGDSTLESALTMPPFSPIFITPSHNDNTPVKPKLISKAFFAASNEPFIIVGNTSMSPKKISFIKATTKAIAQKAIQI